MTVEEAKRRAYVAIEEARAMNAAFEHPPSRHVADMASIVIDLCSQLEQAQAQLAALGPKPAR